MKPVVLKAQDQSETFIDEQCYITELSNTELDEDVSIARARVKPGVTTHWHSLAGTFERYVVIQGKGQVEIGDLPVTVVTAGDVVLIPPQCRQRIYNSGDTDLVFLAICSPRFKPQSYADLECD